MPTSYASSRAGSVSSPDLARTRGAVRSDLLAIGARLDRLLAWPLRFGLSAWRRLGSPLVGPACRFHPSCSRYADEALARFGFVRGSWLALCRLARCHPWSPGGYDPVSVRPGDDSGRAGRG